MATNYIEIVVQQKIPAECMTPIEEWLLKRLFPHGNNGHFASVQDVRFYLEPDAGALVTSDEQLTRALGSSAGVSPNLCHAVERHLKGGQILDLNAFDYEKLFKTIVQRHRDILPWISIEEWNRTCKNVHSFRIILITADMIQSISTGGWLTAEARRSDPHWSDYLTPAIRFRDECGSSV